MADTVPFPPWVDADIPGELTTHYGRLDAYLTLAAERWQEHRDRTRIARALEAIVEELRHAQPERRPAGPSILDQLAEQHIARAMGPDPAILMSALEQTANALRAARDRGDELARRLAAYEHSTPRAEGGHG